MAGDSPDGLAAAQAGLSGDGSQKQKRPRTSKPKVKTGCNNCKCVSPLFFMLVPSRGAYPLGARVLKY